MPRKKKMVTAMPLDSGDKDKTWNTRFAKDEAVKLAAAILNCVVQMDDPENNCIKLIFWAKKHVHVGEVRIPKRFLS